MTVRPHRQYEALAQIMHLLATEAAKALQHLTQERQQLDGWPTATMGDGTPRAGNSSTIPERQTEARTTIDTHINQIRDDITTIATIASSALDVCRQANSYRAPNPPRDQPTYCRDNQTRRDGTIEWGDPTCLNLPDKAGLCSACYLREWRWRKANNLGPRDIEPLPSSA